MHKRSTYITHSTKNIAFDWLSTVWLQRDGRARKWGTNMYQRRGHYKRTSAESVPLSWVAKDALWRRPLHSIRRPKKHTFSPPITKKRGKRHRSFGYEKKKRLSDLRTCGSAHKVVILCRRGWLKLELASFFIRWILYGFYLFILLFFHFHFIFLQSIFLI